MNELLAVAGFLFFFIVVLPWLFKLKRRYFERAINQYAEENGVEIAIEKVGIPPLRFWMSNRKGDCWGRVQLEDGSRKWVRLRTSLLSSGSPLTFYDD